MDDFVTAVDVLVADIMERTTKLCKDVLIKELGSILRCVVLECYRLDPLGTIVGSDKDIPMS